MTARKNPGISARAFKVRYLRRSREIYRRLIQTRPWVSQFYKSFLKLRPGIRIVEVGCGTGDLTRYLAELVGAECSIVGVDMRTASLKTAAAETKKAGLSGKISYRKGYADDIPVEEGYADLTCCRTLLMHLTEPLKAVKEMIRVTRKGGTVAAIERSGMHSFYDPANEGLIRLGEKMYAAYLNGVRKLEGKDFAIGEKLPTLFVEAGLKQVRAEAQADAWLNCDARRRPDDVKDELRFDYEMFRERRSLDRKILKAGGASISEVTRYFRLYEARMRKLLGSNEKLRNDTSLYSAAWTIVTGQKT